MSGIHFLSGQLQKGFSDDPWHGPATEDLLEGLSAEDAAAHPVPGAHSIWEIVLHMTAWQNEARRRLGGSKPSLPQEGDWPRVPRVSEAAWRRDCEALGTSLTTLLETLSTLTEEDLDRTGGSLSDRNPALGTGVTLRAMVAGVLQHNAYHSGQIAVIRKGLEGG